MKKIYSLILVAASLAVAACQPKELDDIVPDVNPDVKSVKITATIENIDATKVEYAISDDAIKPAWQVNDELFGFDADGGKFTYVVKEVDATTGEATIEPKQGTSYTPDEGILVYGIYYPGKTVEDITGTTGEESLAIDLAGQSGTLETASPAIMCATATVTEGEGGENEIRFKFANQTAIIGLKKIQVGTGETLKTGTAVTQIAIEGVVTHGSLSVVDGQLALKPGTKASTVYAVPNPTPDSWVTDEKGQIDFGAEKPVAFAVLPSTHVPTVYAYTATAAFKNGTPMSTKEMAAGHYYYMSKKLDASAEPVASLTVGDVVSRYYNVSDAFDAADCSNEDCTVKLLTDCSTTRNPQIRGTNGSGDITIDLNGKALTMSHQFGVYNSNITICDNSSAELAEQGKITSPVSTAAAYYFSGSTLTLTGGTLENTAESQYALYLYGSSNAIISGGCVKSVNYRAIYQANTCGLTISGGKVEAHGNAIVCNAGRTGETNLDVKGNAIVNSDSTALYVSAGVVSVSGNAQISSDYRYSIYVISGSATISGNCSFENEGNVLYTHKAQGIDAPTVNIEGGYFSNVKEGWTSANSLIYANYGTIYISAGHFTANGVNPLGASSNGTINVTGGYYNKAINSTRLGDTYCNIASSEPGYDFQVAQTSAIASVEASSYTFKHRSLEGVARQLSERKDNATVSPVVTMLDDVTLGSTFTPVAKAGESVTLNLDGHVISAESLSPVVSTSSDLTISDSGNGEIITDGATALEVTAGETTINSGSLVGATNAASVTGGTLKIYNGHFYGGNSSDIDNDGGSVEVSGGWFRNDPDSFVADGYASEFGSWDFNDKSYSYKVAASETIATVNDENYGSLAAAIAAANMYSKAADTVKIKIVADNNVLTHNEAIELNNISGKPIVFDLNGHTLSTSTAQFITATGTSIVIIRDSGAQKGMIFSDQYNIIHAETVGSTITIDGCVIESDADASTTGSNAVVYVKRSAGSGTPYPAVIVDNGAKIYSKNQQPAMYASYGKITLNECEVTSGADGEGAAYGVFQTSYGTVIVNSGASIYSKYTSGTKYSAVHAGSQYGTVTINGGHLSGGYCVTGSSSAKGNVITINGGYFNTAFNLSGQNLSSAIFNGVVASSSEEYYHETTREKLSYGYSIVKAAKIVQLDTEYITLAAAVSAANSNTEAESLTIQLLGNHPKDSAVAPFILNRGDNKKVILDLNGCTLKGADSCFIKTTVGDVDIVDSATKKGKIISSAENVIVKSGGAGVLTIDGCTIASTNVPNSTYNMDAVVYQYNSSSTVNIKNSIIYSTKALTTLSNRGGTMNIEDSEISSGTESAGLITLFNGGTSANTEITGGCFYNTTNTSDRGLFYIGIKGSVGTITVNSGYFYGTKFGRGYATSSQFANIKLKGGYFNLRPKSEYGEYYPTIESGYDLDPDATGGFYHHSIVGDLTDFSYQVIKIGEASVEASTSTPVVTLGEARNGGVSF